MTVPLTINDLTEAKLDGTGAFDVLMRASKGYLEEEYAKQRIRGPEYSQVYLGSLTAVLDSAVQFLLSKDKAANEAALIQAQIELTEVQKLKVEAEADLVRQQILNAEVENRVLEAQICKLKAEYDVLLESRAKTVAEAALLAQRTATERAQTVGAGVDVDSVIGRQKVLYQSQADGFKRDAEQKAAKLLVDSWNVRRTTDEGTTANVTNKLDDATVGRVVGKLLEGVNA